MLHESYCLLHAFHAFLYLGKRLWIAPHLKWEWFTFTSPKGGMKETKLLLFYSKGRNHFDATSCKAIVVCKKWILTDPNVLREKERIWRITSHFDLFSSGSLSFHLREMARHHAMYLFRLFVSFFFIKYYLRDYDMRCIKVSLWHQGSHDNIAS